MMNEPIQPAPQTPDAAPSPYRQILEATRADPEDVGAWVRRARAAGSAEERIFCLSQVNRLDPDNQDGREGMYRALWNELARDSFLAYIEETDHIYYVRSRDYLALAVPKDRERPPEYPPKSTPLLAPAHRNLIRAFLGLLLSGLGTFIFAPLAIRDAGAVLQQAAGRPDRIRAWIVIWISLFLLGLASLLAWLLIIRL